MTTIYHNPNCSTSCKVLDMIRAQGVEPHVVDYMKTPLTEDQITALLAQMNVSARDVLRDKAKPYEELGLDDPKWTQKSLSVSWQNIPNSSIAP